MVCRLCLQNSSEVLEIFNNKGQESKIAMVIGKHFWFEPKIEDPVSSHICNCCWTKLSDFHEFYKYVEKAQQLLTVEVIVKTEYKLTACDIAVEDVELASKYVLKENIEEQYEEPFNITSDVLAEDSCGVIEFEFPTDLKDQIIDFVNNEKKKDNQDIYAIHDHKEDESNVQFQINDKKKILRKKGTKLKKSSKRNKIESLTEEAKTTYKGRGRPHKGELAHLKSKSNCNEEKAATLRTYNDDIVNKEKKKDEQSEVCQKTNAFRGVLYSLKHHVQQSDGKYVCNICKKSYKMAKSIKEHMLEHTGLSLYSCPHCSRTFNYISAMNKHRKQKHIKEFEEFRKLRKISARSKEPIILTISSLSDDTKNSFELPSEHDLEKNIEEQYEEPYNITSNALADDFKDQSIDIVNNDKKDDQDISTIYDEKVNERDLQFLINDKKKILRKKSTKLKKSSKRNKIESLTEEATTTYIKRGRPRKGEMAHLKSKSNCNKEKNAKLRTYNDDIVNKEKKKDEQSEVCQKTNAFRGVLYSHKHHVQQSDGKYVCNICKKSYKMAKSIKEHMLQHTRLSLYRCPHCIRTFNCISNMQKHRKEKHPKEFEEFRKIIKISSQRKEIIIPTISSLSDATMNYGEVSSKHNLGENMNQQYEEPFNRTSDVLAEDNYCVIENAFPPDLKNQSIDIVNNEEKKDDQDIYAIHGHKEDEINVQFQINDKKKILRKKVTKIKKSSKRNKRFYSLTEEATTTYKGRGRPRKGEVVHLKSKSNCNKEKAAKLRTYNDECRFIVTTQEMPEIINRKISEYMQLKCDVCGTELDTFRYIRNHMRLVHDIRPYVKCCEKKLYSRALLYDHIKFHLNPDIYKCKKCGRVFWNKRNLTVHNICVHQPEDAKIFKCQQCPKKFATKYFLHKHKTQQHYKVLKHFCPECKRGYPYKSALTFHMAWSHGTMCDICSEIVKGPDAFKRHQLKHHGIVEPTTSNKVRLRPRIGDVAPLKNKSNSNEKKSAKLRIYRGPSRSNVATQEMPEIINRKISEYMQLKCDVCGTELDTFCNIRNHMRLVHDTRPYVKCCEKKLFSRALLYDHIKFHLNPDIYKCEKCGRVFWNKRNLTVHNICVHQPEDAKIFKCQRCPQKFVTKYFLQKHKTQQHYKVLKHFCPECKRGYPYKSSLTFHIAWSHGTMCDICSEIVKGPDAFKRHQLKHQDIVEPTTIYKGRGRPRIGDVAPLKNNQQSEGKYEGNATNL